VTHSKYNEKKSGIQHTQAKNSYFPTNIVSTLNFNVGTTSVCSVALRPVSLFRRAEMEWNGIEWSGTPQRHWKETSRAKKQRNVYHYNISELYQV
jgi:hypothetical protein